jgi:hypothetical protein
MVVDNIVIILIGVCGILVGGLGWYCWFRLVWVL